MPEAPKNLSPREVFMKVLELQFSDVSELADLFAEEGVMEFPFTPNGTPNRIEGRQAIRTFVTEYGFSSTRLRLDAHNDLVIRETTDPEIIIVECTTEVTWVSTAKNYLLPCIQVIQVKNGQILLYRDYVNPISAARATGKLQQLAHRLGTED
jgi:ketosteroid isomerase-like protein